MLFEMNRQVVVFAAATLAALAFFVPPAGAAVHATIVGSDADVFAGIGDFSTGADHGMDLTITPDGATYHVSDPAGLSAGSGCTVISATEADCAAPTNLDATFDFEGFDFPDSVIVDGPWTLGKGRNGGPNGSLMQFRGGEDVFEGAYGSVQVSMGMGNDTVTLPGDDDASLDDLVIGDDGNDTVDAGPGNDTIGQFGAESGDDDFEGGPGRDLLIGDTGSDRLSGGPGPDSVDGSRDGDDSDQLFCGDGDDYAFAGPQDSVSSDCENLYQEVSCPDTCDVTIGVTAPPPGSGKRSGGKQIVLAKKKYTIKGKRKLKVPFIESGVRKALRGRSQAPALEKIVKKAKSKDTTKVNFDLTSDTA